MKKYLLLAVFFAVAGLATISAQRLGVGLKAGYNSSEFSTDISSGSVKEDAKNGFLVGAFARVKLLGDLSFQPEVYYARKNGTLVYNSETVDIQTNSWNIPLLAHLSIVDLKVLRLYAATGPVMSFNADKASLPTTSSLKDEAMTWGYQLGAGVEVWKFGVDARYEWGLNNVSEGKIKDAEFTRKSNMFTLALTYRIFGL